eukprot:scaffold274_cov119-Cylindrotheca_fusiformis.AAC.2
MIALVSTPYELSKLFDWLEPKEILAVSAVNRTFYKAAEDWCRVEGVPRKVVIKRAEIEGICEIIHEIQTDHNLTGHDPFCFYEKWTSPPDLRSGLGLLFESYTGFLQAILLTPLSDKVVQLSSWKERYIQVSKPRPPAIRQNFDFGYPDAGSYWCDTFGCGAPNDYFRLVGDSPNEYWSLCLAGSDAHHIRWRNAYTGDRSLDPVPATLDSTMTPPRNDMLGNDSTEWDKVRIYWRKCAAHVAKKRWRLD